jgi:general secretion pathway protein G
MKKFHEQAGFTLIEMLVVLVIIGLLAGLVGPKLFGKVDSSKIETAKTQIKMLKNGLETLRLDLGRYPSKEEGLTLLDNPPADERLRSKWRGPYLDESVPVDPWGTIYQYEVPGINGRPFLLFSFGADGKRGGEENDADIGIAANEGSNR